MIAGVEMEKFTAFGNSQLSLSLWMNLVNGDETRVYCADCVVLPVDIWNETFADWPVTRVSAAAANGEAAA